MKRPAHREENLLSPQTMAAFKFDARRSFELNHNPTVNAFGEFFGITNVFSRASIGTYRDSDGNLRFAALHQPRWQAIDTDSDGVSDLFGLLLESNSTNILQRSEDLNHATWVNIGTPVVTSAALTMGDLVLDLLNDNDGAALEGKRQSRTNTYATGGTKTFSFFIAKGTSTSVVLRVRDTTALANRWLGAISWGGASGQVPSISYAGGGTGTTVRAERWGTVNGIIVWRIMMHTTSGVVGGNAHDFEIYPASTNGLATANTGTVYIGGLQTEDRTHATSYIRTAGASGSRSQDFAYFTWDAKANRAMALVLDVIDYGTNTFAHIGDAVSGNPRLNLTQNGGLAVLHHNGSSSVTATATGTALATGQRVKVRGGFSLTGAAFAEWSIDGATTSNTSAAPATGTVGGAWSLGRLWLGGPAAATGGSFLLLSAKLFFDDVSTLATLDATP